MWSRDCGATLFDESRRRRDVGSTALRAVTLTAGERACGEPVKDLKKSSDARHLGSRFAADPAPACAKRWRGACAVLWARPADSVSAGNAGDQSKLRSRQRHHWGRWRGTPILHRGSVSNAGYNKSEALRWR